MRLLIGDLIDEKDGEEDTSYMTKDGKNTQIPRPGRPLNSEWKKQQEEAIERMTKFTQKDFPFIQQNKKQPPKRRQRMDDDDDDDYDEDDED